MSRAAMIRSWRHRCPDCGTEMTATGKVFKASAGFWHVEFFCAVDAEKFRIATSEWNRLLSPAPAPVISEAHAYLAEPSTWFGDFYSLAIAVGTRDDDRIRRAWAALWSFGALEGCFVVASTAPAAVKRVTADEMSVEQAALGVATLRDGARVACRSSLVREDEGIDWLYLDFPLTALARHYPVEDFPGPCRDMTWRWGLDAWMRSLADRIYFQTSFRLAAVGWTASPEVQLALAQGVPAQRFCGFVTPGHGKLDWHPPVPDPTLPHRAHAPAPTVPVPAPPQTPVAPVPLAPLDGIDVPAPTGQRQTRARTGHLLAVEGDDGLVVVRDHAGRPYQVRRLNLRAIERGVVLRSDEHPVDPEDDFASSSSSDEPIAAGTATIAVLGGPQGPTPVIARWQRVRVAGAPRTGAADGAWLLLKLPDRILPVVHRTDDGFTQCGSLFLSGSQLDRVVARGVQVRDLAHGWTRLEFPRQPLGVYVDLLIGPARERALSLEHLATGVVEILGRDARPLVLPAGPELSVAWSVTRITGYGAAFGHTLEALSVQILHRRKPLSIILGRHAGGESFRTDRAWLRAINQAAVAHVGGQRWRLDLKGRATTTMNGTEYGQQIEIDLAARGVVMHARG